MVWEGGVIWEWDSIPIQGHWDRCLNHGEWRSGWSQICGRDQRRGGQGWCNVGKHSHLWMYIEQHSSHVVHAYLHVSV